MLVYLDTSVWAAVTIPNDWHMERGKKVIEKVLSFEDNRILVSSLVLLELGGVVRQRLIDHENGNVKNEYISNEERAVKERIVEATTRIMDGFTAQLSDLATAGKVIVDDPKLDYKSFISNVTNLFLSILSDPDGLTVRPGDQNSKKSYSIKSAGHWDVQHALIAKQLMADEIVSFDKDFKQLSESREFDGIKIRTSY